MVGCSGASGRFPTGSGCIRFYVFAGQFRSTSVHLRIRAPPGGGARLLLPDCIDFPRPKPSNAEDVVTKDHQPTEDDGMQGQPDGRSHHRAVDADVLQVAAEEQFKLA